MRKKTKASGTSFENRVKKHFVKYGWKVFRSAGSKSCADLIAFHKSGRTLWIQCKASELPSLGAAEKREIHTGQKFYGVEALVVTRQPRTWELVFWVFENDISSQLVRCRTWSSE